MLFHPIPNVKANDNDFSIFRIVFARERSQMTLVQDCPHLLRLMSVRISFITSGM